MNGRITALADRLAENREVLKQSVHLEPDRMVLAGASILTCRGMRADRGVIDECAKILKDNAGALSEYRGMIRVPLLCKMAASGTPEHYIRCVQEIEDLIRHTPKIRHASKIYRILAAMTVQDHSAQQTASETVDRMRALYVDMKNEHPWLTGEEDLPFAALLSASGKNPQKLTDDTEACFSILRNHFKSGNVRQTLSHVLALSDEEPEEKCLRAADLAGELKRIGHRISTDRESVILGAAALTGVSAPDMAQDIAEADEYLKQKKGFGNISAGTQQRRMFAGLLAICSADPELGGSAVSTAVAVQTAIEIQMQVCMMIMMSTSTAAVTCATSS